MIEEKIRAIADSPLGESMSGKYTNTLILNGFVLQQPKFIRNENRNNESCSFIIHQIGRNLNGEVLDKTYSIITYLPNLVESLKGIKTCVFISCFCRLEWTPKLRSYTCQMYAYELGCELDMKLESEYKKDGN